MKTATLIKKKEVTSVSVEINLYHGLKQIANTSRPRTSVSAIIETLIKDFIESFKVKQEGE